MLPRLHRLTREADFSRIYKKGKRLSTPHLLVFFLPQSQNTPRFGFVISKKHAAKITQRNRIKRILRDEAQKLINKGNLRIEGVISGRPGISQATPQEIRRELNFLLKKAYL